MSTPIERLIRDLCEDRENTIRFEKTSEEQADEARTIPVSEAGATVRKALHVIARFRPVVQRAERAVAAEGYDVPARCVCEGDEDTPRRGRLKQSSSRIYERRKERTRQHERRLEKIRALKHAAQAKALRAKTPAERAEVVERLERELKGV